MHKLLRDHPTANLINYMSQHWSSVGKQKPRRTEFIFRGFLPLPDGERWGVELDGVCFAAVHIFEQDWHWGDNKKDTDEVSKERPWIVMYYGSDNTSYYERFKTREEADAHFDALTAVPDREVLFYYNS